MNNKFIYVASLLLTFAFAGCNEDFLTQEPYGKIASENYLENEADLNKAIAGVYNKIQHNYSNGSWASAFMIKNLPGDDVLTGSSEGDQPEYQYLDDYLIESDNAKLETMWVNFYKTINACNTIISVTEAKPTQTESMKTIVGEAKAIRAFSYMELVTMFGAVPLSVVNPTAAADYHKPRTPEAQVYAQIEKDLKEAIAVLPLKSAYSAGDKYRIAKGTAQAWLGKAQLYQEKYSEAATTLGTVISSAEYDLEPNFGDVWSMGAEFGTESLFEVSYVANEAYDWGTFPWGGGNESNIEIQLEGPRGDWFKPSYNLYEVTKNGVVKQVPDYEWEPIYKGDGWVVTKDPTDAEKNKVVGSSKTTMNINGGWGFNNPTKKLGDLMIAEGEGARYAGSIMTTDEFIATGGGIDFSKATHDFDNYIRLKYATTPDATSTSGVAELNYAINWRLLRYADVLLMAAEAYHKSGNDGQAVIELNKVRDRAGMADVSATGNDLFLAIVKERQIELAFEATRYWDLVRWGLADQELKSIGFVKGKHEHYPIPKNEIIANNALTDADQNPGY